MLSHRTVWSAVFFAARAARAGARRRGAGAARPAARLAVLAVSAVMIAVNWLVFIHAVQVGHALEASLGYYVFPLVAVALGYLVLGERFSRVQGVAIGLAAAAVLVLGVGLGAPPWTALTLASSFGAYGLVRGRCASGRW